LDRRDSGSGETPAAGTDVGPVGAPERLSPEHAGSERFGPDPCGEFPFNPTDYLFHLLHAIGRLKESQVEAALGLLDLNIPRYRVLTMLGRLGPCSMSELAMISAIDRTTLTRAIDQLIGADFVRRDRDPGDRRKVVIALAPAGQALCRRADDFVCNHGRYLMEGVDDALMRDFIRLERTLVARLAPDAAAAQAILAYSLPDAGDTTPSDAENS
jgi:DNA-binding MarR family transcriptional regulator